MSAILIVIEMDLPLLKIEIPPGYNNRKINLNEILQLKIVPDASQDPDELRYSASIIYDFETKAVFRFLYLEVQFKIWYFFLDVGIKDDIQIKLTAKDPYYYMPSVSTAEFKLNLPPFGELTVTPAMGDALITLFKIDVDLGSDFDLPLTYKFHIYKDPKTMEQDIILGLDNNKVVLTDFQESPVLETLLPSASGGQNTMVVLVTISDNLGGLKNLTQLIHVKSVAT